MFSGKKSGPQRPSINVSDGELDILIQDIFQLSSLNGVSERPITPQTPTSRGTTAGGRNTPQLGIQTNGTGYPSPSSHRGRSVMNAYPPTSSHTDLPVQVRVVPPTGSSMATQMERPVAVTADRVAPIPLHAQDSGSMKREGAERVSRLQDMPEPESRGKEASRSDPVVHLDPSKRDFIKKVDPNAHQSEPAATSSATTAKEAVQVQGAASNPKGVVENKGQGPVRKTETTEQGSGKTRPERARTQSEQLAAATTSTLDPRFERSRSYNPEPTKKEQQKIETVASVPEPPKRETTPKPTPIPTSATASTSTFTSTSAAQAHRTLQHKKQSASTPGTTGGLFGFVSSFIGSTGDPGYESSSRESEDDTPMAGAWRSRDTKARHEREKAEAEAKARAQAQEESRLRVEAEAAKARADAEEKEREEAARVAEAEARRVAAEAKRAEAKAKREAKAAKAKAEAEARQAQAKLEAEAKAKADADAKAAAKAEAEAEEKARKEREEAARAKEKADAEAKKAAAEAKKAEAKREAEAKAKADAAAAAKVKAEVEAREAQAKLEADIKAAAKAQADAQEKARKEQEEAEAKAEAEAQQAKLEAEAKQAQAEAEAEAQKAKAEADAKAAREATAKAEADARKKREADAKAKSEAEAREKAEVEAREKRKRETEAKAKADKAAEEEKAKVAEEAKAVAAKAEAEAKGKEKERLGLEARLKAEAAAKAKEEERKRVEAEKAEQRTKQAEEQIARQRAADKAAKAAAAASASSPMSPAWGSGGGGGWLSQRFSKIASAAASVISPEDPPPSPKPANLNTSSTWAKHQARNALSPGTEFGPVGSPRSPGGPGAHQHSPTTSSTARGSASTYPATPLKAAHSSASIVSSSPTLVSQEIKDHQDGKRDRLTYRILTDRSLGKAGDSKGKQTAAAQSTETVPDDQSKSKTPVATPGPTVPPKATDPTSQSSDVTGGDKAPDVPGDKPADSAPSLIKVDSTQAPKSTSEEVAKPKDSAPTSSAPANPADTTPPLPELETSPDDATVTNPLTSTSEPAASASAKPNGESEVPKAPDADAKKASEAPAQTEASSVKQGTIEKSDEAAADPLPQPPNQNGEAGGEKKPATAKGDDAKPDGPVKPNLRLDHIRETSTASTMSVSSPGTPADDIPLSSVDKEDDGEASGTKLTKSQKKRMRDKAKRQAQKGEKNSPRLSSGATSNSVDNSVVQETKPVATVPVDTPVNVPAGEGEGVFVDKKTESGEDDEPVIVEMPQAVTTRAEKASDEDDDMNEDISWW